MNIPDQIEMLSILKEELKRHEKGINPWRVVLIKYYDLRSSFHCVYDANLTLPLPVTHSIT